MPPWTTAHDLYTGEEYLTTTIGNQSARVWRDDGEWFVTIVTVECDREVWPGGYPTQEDAQEDAEAFLLMR